MSDGRKASPLIRKAKGQAVLGYASVMDREHCARPIARLHTSHSYATKRHREGDWQLRSIFSAWLLHPQQRHSTALTRVMSRPFTHTNSVGRGRARP